MAIRQREQGVPRGQASTAPQHRALLQFARREPWYHLGITWAFCDHPADITSVAPEYPVVFQTKKVSIVDFLEDLLASMVAVATSAAVSSGYDAGIAPISPTYHIDIDRTITCTLSTADEV